MYNNRTPQKPEQPLQKHKNPTAGNTEKENARALLENTKIALAYLIYYKCIFHHKDYMKKKKK
jgi:hypothetical protein